MKIYREVIPMRKPDKREHINLFFSAFLITAFIVCANFFANFTSSQDSMTAQLVSIAVYAVFGLLLFYATRVGDGKAIMRFSPLTLIVMVVPALFIIIASLAAFMPLHDAFAADSGRLSLITSLAAVALGYGIPYTFFSGFELEEEETEQDGEESDDGDESRKPVLEGGVEADILDAEESAAAEEEEADMQEL